MRFSLENQKEALCRHWLKAGIIKDSRLLDAFKATAREKFVLKDDRARAYGDYPLSILQFQTISQPTTVMLMTQALEAEIGMKVLEVGTGSGYQAAILSAILGESGRVISLEYYKVLADFACGNLIEADCRNVRVIHGDGGNGWEPDAPYDRIIVTCACPTVPPPLLMQLKTGGIMVLPIKTRFSEDMRVIKKSAGRISTESIGAFTFVPLLGEYG